MLAGLRLARAMGVERLTAYVDSLIVSNQINGVYEVKGVNLTKYVAKVKEMASVFEKFEIKHIPRSKNKREDALGKLASSAFGHLTRVLVEVLGMRSIDKEIINDVTMTPESWIKPLRD